ncbi:type VII secretion protein EssB [Metabacillus sp. HB246100]
MSTQTQSHFSYLQEKIEADVTQKDQTITFSFQKEKIKLDHPHEVSFLSEVNQTIQKKIEMKDDELCIEYKLPQTYSYFPRHVQRLDEKERYILAYHLVQLIKQHSLSRVHLLVCPENIVFDQGLQPYLLHFGVMESLPPYEKNSDQLFQEVKATVATLLDCTYTFERYVRFFQTLKLSSLTKRIHEASSLQDLLIIIEENLERLKKDQANYTVVKKQSWKLTRGIMYGVIICFIPALIYSLYSFFFVQPKQTSFIQAQEFFLQDQYSDVVTELQPYEIEDMPIVTQYELALSYIINESLTEDQKETVRNTVTLQTDPQYFHYWIYIGRGEAEEALDIARFLEDRDLVQFGLLKYKEQVKSDDELDREERQQTLAEIEDEINEYERQKEEIQAAEEKEVNEGTEGTVEADEADNGQLTEPAEQAEPASAPEASDASNKKETESKEKSGE